MAGKPRISEPEPSRSSWIPETAWEQATSSDTSSTEWDTSGWNAWKESKQAVHPQLLNRSHLIEAQTNVVLDWFDDQVQTIKGSLKDNDVRFNADVQTQLSNNIGDGISPTIPIPPRTGGPSTIQAPTPEAPPSGISTWVDARVRGWTDNDVTVNPEMQKQLSEDIGESFTDNYLINPTEVTVEQIEADRQGTSLEAAYNDVLGWVNEKVQGFKDNDVRSNDALQAELSDRIGDVLPTTPGREETGGPSNNKLPSPEVATTDIPPRTGGPSNNKLPLSFVSTGSPVNAAPAAAERVLPRPHVLFPDAIVLNDPAGEADSALDNTQNSLVDRIIQAESGGDAAAVGSSGEVGLMQIMESTGLQPGFGVDPISSEDRYDPEKNKAFGTAYLDAMLNRYDGDEEAALIAYNAGFGNADKWLAAGRDYSVLPQQATTEAYVSRVLGTTTTAEAATFEAVVEYVGNLKSTISNNEMAAAGVSIPGLDFDTSFDMNGRESFYAIFPEGVDSQSVEDMTDSGLLSLVDEVMNTDYMSEEMRDILNRDGLGEAGGSRETLLADILAHDAATEAAVTMSYLRPVREAWGKMKSEDFVRWMDATRGRDTVHILDSETALHRAGYTVRSWLGELLPSDRFWNMFAFEGMDAGSASPQHMAVALDGPARVVLRAARNFRTDR